MITLILMVFAFVCLVLAAFGVSAPRIQIGWLGLAFWALAIVVGRTPIGAG